MKILVCLSFFFVSLAMAEIKIGYVDLQKAIQLTKAGKKAKASLEKEFNRRKKELSKQESDIRKMGEDLEKKKAVLTATVLQQKQMLMQREMLKYRELAGKNQMELSKRERDLTAPILEKMKSVIEKVAKSGSYTMILERGENSVVWADKTFDLTGSIVSEFDKMK